MSAAAELAPVVLALPLVGRRHVDLMRICGTGCCQRSL